MTESFENRLQHLPEQLADAVAQYWRVRARQSTKQAGEGKLDQGARGAVTGGAQMDGFVSLLADIVEDAAVPRSCIRTRSALELPGFFRPTKEWDLVVVRDSRLVAAIEVKSQVGPSFGNNFNNRTEEAMGSALDLWTAFREGAFGTGPAPFVGYFFLLEDSIASRRPVHVSERNFPVFAEFRDSSYVRRYELFCRKLVMERHYSAAALLFSTQSTDATGQYQEPAEDLTASRFVRMLYAHVSAVGCD